MTPQEGFTAPHQLSSCSGLTHLFRSWLIIPSNTELNSLSGSWPAVWRACPRAHLALTLTSEMLRFRRSDWRHHSGDSPGEIGGASEMIRCLWGLVCVQNLFQLLLETNFFLCNDHPRAPGTCKKPVRWASFEMRMSWPEQQGNFGVEKQSWPEYMTEV